jgi:hypothetical protein
MVKSPQQPYHVTANIASAMSSSVGHSVITNMIRQWYRSMAKSPRQRHRVTTNVTSTTSSPA